MIDFITWRLCEVFDTASILAHQPQDGVWEPPLNRPGSHTYYFNVPGDDCSDTNTSGMPCYKVVVSGGEDNVSISFKRGSGGYNDEGRGVGKLVMMGVLHGLAEAIEAIKPKQIAWSAVQKTKPNPVTGKIENAEARASVYDKWAIRNLFPDKYIGGDGRWIRSDIYNQDYVPKGYPPVPENVTADSSAAEKTAVIEQIREKIKGNQEQITRAEREIEEERERRRNAERLERERERRELRERWLQQAIADPQRNPNGIAVGDLVTKNNHGNDYDDSRHHIVGKVDKFTLGYYGDGPENDELYVFAKFGTEEEPENYTYNRRMLASTLVKETPETKQQRDQALQQAIANPEKNPNGIAVGDMVFLSDHGRDYNDRYHSPIGKVERIKIGERGYGRGEDEDIYADVKFGTEDSPDDYAHGRAIKISRLLKETPEARQQREQQRQAEMQAAIADRTKNPNGVQEGDDIVTFIPGNPTSKQNGLTGKLIKLTLKKRTMTFRSDTTGTYLLAKIEWDEHSKEILGYNAEKELSPENIRKRTPEEMERIRQARINHDIEQEIERRREREGRNAPQHQEADPSIIGDTENNPQGLKPGDYVVVTGHWRYRDRKGIIISMQRNSWNHGIEVSVKFHRSRAEPTKFPPRYLVKDTSEEAQQMQQRQQQRVQRSQTIQQGTNGLQIGDTVKVTSGLNRNKLGRILGFTPGTTGNVRATCVDAENRRFTANINSLQSQEQRVQTPQTPEQQPTTA